MSLSKKHYEAIAREAVRARALSETQNQRRGVERMARCVADYFTADNPRFDRARFLKACGLEG